MMIVTIAGAFGFGHIRETSKAVAKANQQHTEDNAAATFAPADHRVEATEEANILVLYLTMMLITSCAQT